MSCILNLNKPCSECVCDECPMGSVCSLTQGGCHTSPVKNARYLLEAYKNYKNKGYFIPSDLKNIDKYGRSLKYVLTDYYVEIGYIIPKSKEINEMLQITFEFDAVLERAVNKLLSHSKIKKLIKKDKF